jgi:uncharacterized membrane protein YhaH (DUF805 family)
MNLPKTTVRWIGLSVIVILVFLVTISDNPLVSFAGLPVIIIVLVLVGLAGELLTGDRARRKAAVEQIKRNFSDKKLLIRAAVSAVSVFLWPVVLAIEVATLAWKARSFLLSFEGRASRKTYWNTHFLYFAWAATTALTQAMILGLTQRDINESVPPFAYYTTLILAIGPIVASAPAIGVKRLHDINKSGWWLLLFYLVPAIWVGILILAAVPQNVRGLVLLFLFLPVTVWAFIDLGCRRGTRGPNKYGVDTERTAGSSTPPAH